MIPHNMSKRTLRPYVGVPHLLLLIFLLSEVTACAVLPKTPSETNRQDWSTVVIAPARFAPTTNFKTFAVGKTKGATKGAVIGGGLGVAHLAAFAVTGGPLALIIAPYLAIIEVPVMITAGSKAGLFASVTSEDAEAVDALIQQNLKSLNIQQNLAKLVATTLSNDTGKTLDINENTGPFTPDVKGDYSELARTGTGGVLEIAAKELGFANYGKKLYFFIVVQVRMIRPDNGEQLYSREFVYVSDLYDGENWAVNNAALFAAELQRAYLSIAESIVENIFLLTDLPLETKYRDPDQKTQTLLSPIGGDEACGLAWRFPQRVYAPTIFGEQIGWNLFPEIATQQPELEWEAFPRVVDQRANHSSLLRNVSNIRYDLRIWVVENAFPPQLIYERKNLTFPSHTIDQQLESGKRYFWSVRALFEVNEKTHATRWGCYRTPWYDTNKQADKHVKPQASPVILMGGFIRDPCNLDFIPTANYYRFKIP